MKRLSIILSALFVVSLVSVACNEDEKTELAWENGTTNTAINTIVWADETNNAWVRDGGYDEGDVTEYKQVEHTVGDVYCSIDIGGGDFEQTTATIGDTGLETAALTENEKNLLTIVATAKK